WRAEMVEKVIEHAETTEKTRVGMPKKEEELSLEDIISKYEKRKIKEKDLSGETESKKDSTSDFMDSLDQKSRTKFENLLEKLREIFTITKDKIILPTFKLAKKLIIKLAGVFLKKSESEFEFPQQTKLLSSRKKIILVVFIFIVFILTGGLVFKNYKDSENERLNTYASLLIQAEKKLNKAEIDSIVNPIEARRSLIEAKNILGARNTSLDNKNNYRDLSNKTAILLKEIQKQLDIIDLVNKIENPAVAIDFSQIENIINPKKIFKENKKYYIFDLESKILNGINFDEKKLNNFKIEITGNINLDNLSTLMEKTGEIMLLENSNKIAIFNIDKKTFLYTDIEFAENMSGTKDIDSYSNFMYLLNPDSNQIYKYKRLANGFDKRQDWLEKEDAHIENAVSMAIDGSIYLLNSNGSIDKFRTGNKITEFSTESPSNPISSSAKIYTKPEFKYLYVSDPPQNRVVLFNKTSGKLAGQYTSDKFSDLKNIVVDAKEEKIYILSGNKVFKVGIEIEN
ncbi:MAG: hypothetical protein KAS78_04430, partial [Candidatus Pacebacteria bacterium]|nr:hypothetical protein [Candidatus Paceibacterota bacterium]